MPISKLVHSAIIAASLATGAASAENLIHNGGFEDYTVNVNNGGYTMVGNGSHAITGWNVGATSVDLIKNSYGSVTGTSIDMLGTPGPGLISQSFNYSANTTYTLTFDLSRNPGAGGSETALYVDFFGHNHEFTGTSTVQHETLSFTTGATGGSQLLSFGSVRGDRYSGAVLDNVSLTAAVPEPETYAMLAAGLALIGLVRRRKAKAA